MAAAMIGLKDYSLLGRLFFKRHPEAAAALLFDFRHSGQTDIERLPFLFSHYCQLIGKNAADLISSPYNRDAIHSRKVFIGAIISIYQPKAIEDPDIMRETRSGIKMALAKVLGIPPSHIGKMTSEIIQHIRVYDSFRQEVVEVTEKLSSYGQQNQKQEDQ